MAFCSNCGTNVPDGIGFCPACGAPIETAMPAASGAIPTAPSRPAKRKLPLILTLAGVGVVALVLVILFLTGVLGAKGPVGVWESNLPLSNSGDTYTLVLEKGGKGYLKSTNYYSGEPRNYYHPVQWNEKSKTIQIMNGLYRGEVCQFSWDGDSMNFMYDSELVMLHRTAKSAPSSKKAASGTYTVTAAYRGNRFDMSDYAGYTLKVNSDGSATLTGRYDLVFFTWDEHFFYESEDGGATFYEFDGKTLTLIDGYTRIEFTRG